MTEMAKLSLPDGKSMELPVLTGSENEKAIDISDLRKKTGYITLIQALLIQVCARVRFLTLTESMGYYDIAVFRLRN